MRNGIETTLRRSWLYYPPFPDAWRRQSLYSLATWVNGLPFRKIDFSSGGLPVIKIAEVKGGISGQTKFTEQIFGDSFRVKHGDMIFSWSGQPETSIDVFWWRGPEGWLNQHLFRVTPASCVDPSFLYYILRYLNPNFVAIASNKQTTGLGHVTKSDLESIVVAYPPLPEQRAIAHILGTLDDKIELNRRMNETLEAMAGALFKSWFVDFDPVRAKAAAKANGTSPEEALAEAGISPDLAPLFPDEFEDSALGPIPKGWEVGELGDIANNPRRSVQPEECGPEEPYIGLEHMPRKCITLGDWGSAEVVTSNKSRFFTGEFLYGKLRPYFHKVGVALVGGVCSTDIVVVSPLDGDWTGLVLFTISSEDFVSYTDAASTGTKMPRTNWKDMARYQIVLPPRALAANFSVLVDDSLQRLRANVFESRSLADCRDTLLPKLLSGEVRVGKAEALAAEVV